jgi:hypothetical protein
VPADPARSLAITLTEDMYAAIVAELGHRTVSRELRESVLHAASADVVRPWPERVYVVTCARHAAVELSRHLDSALQRSGGVRRGTLARALLRIADSVRAEALPPPSGAGSPAPGAR